MEPANGAKISNVIVEGSNYHATLACGAYDATIENCINNSNFSYENIIRYGGMLMSLYGNEKVQIKNCMNTGSIKSTANIKCALGGIVGNISETTSAFTCIIDNCINYGFLGCLYGTIGGITTTSDISVPPSQDKFQIRNCVNIGAMITNNGQIGGIVGGGN